MSTASSRRREQFARDLRDIDAYNEMMAYFEPTQRAAASIIRRHHHAKRATTTEEKALPIHSAAVKTIRLLAACERMLPEKRERFQKVWREFVDPRATGLQPTTEEPQKSAFFSAADTAVLERDGIIKRVDHDTAHARPTLGCVKAFSVVELAKGRRRAIHWPEQHNAVSQRLYTPDVPLQHISAYLDDVHSECGAVFDLKCGFWQVQLPETARAWYRFRDAAGNLYEMNRMLMGHRAAVELMQLLTSVIAGDPEVVSAEFAAPARVRVWVDGFRFSGTKEDVTRAIKRANAAADHLHATYKEDVSAPEFEYDFIGVRWNHHRHTVRVADKTFDKLPQRTPATLLAREIEQLTGRLIFTAGVTQTPLVKHYFAMKWAKRVCHAINVGRTRIDDVVTIPDGMREAFDDWLRIARDEHKPHSTATSNAWPTLFTDATLEGYGAVLIMPSNQVFVTGATFDDTTEQHIAVREAQAVLYALQDFYHLLRDAAGVELRIDNTTVEHSIRRGGARSDVLAKVIADVFAVSIDKRVKSRGTPMLFRVERVASEDNLADKPSRGEEIDCAMLAAELAKRKSPYERRGLAGTW